MQLSLLHLHGAFLSNKLMTLLMKQALFSLKHTQQLHTQIDMSLTRHFYSSNMYLAQKRHFYFNIHADICKKTAQYLIILYDTSTKISTI